MAHVTVPDAEEHLDKEYKVLDHGFIRLVDYMGGDARIVQAARVSYGKGTKTVRKDEALIAYMLSHHHTSPFEQVVLTFHCKMPIFVARQWVRHRTARLNEISGRYSVMKDEFYVPDAEVIRKQSNRNKQGGDEDFDVPMEQCEHVINALQREQREAYDNYTGRIDAEISRELCRINLPLSLYTQWYWQIDLNNLMRFLFLRMDKHAQWEIRQYANVMGELTKAVVPMAYAAFEEHVWGAKRLSATELDAVRAMCEGHELREFGEEYGLSGRALDEFVAKLELPPKPVHLKLVEVKREAA
jgi:thymidylate synthase (FAD)